jgi:hypothetical protein
VSGGKQQYWDECEEQFHGFDGVLFNEAERKINVGLRL